ncbi:MAG TPA: hypothetical protein VK023_02740 [Sphingobacterium bovisgrunnientis]|jgi:hypothetical protein|uniref:hypothetical protein n=1 Tax=Sphingobacterium cavernae TaxID=2592657 RepID=UPI00123005DA|nr:hypothetical protein [Sphingobacterium cavernae]HLS37164.1 hypothetical protein [Sphingobacterium bovisgrunnientis]
MKISLLLSIVLLLIGCQSNRTNNAMESTDTLQNIGGTKDKNGCLTAAGYTWSQLKNDCIQPFTEGISLDILNTANSYQTAAFILLDSVQKKAEVFVAEEDESIILDQSNDTLYSNGKFHLTKENFCWTLSLNKIKLYQERK